MNRTSSMVGSTPRDLLAAGLLAMVLSASPASAAVVAGVSFSDELTVDGQTLELRGAALLRYKIFLKAYVAALYVEPKVAPAGPLRGAGRRLEIEYFWSIPAAGFADATREGMARNLGDEAYLALRSRIEYLNRLYRDVEPGDRYAITYLPDVGTELSLNGKPLGLIEGDDFASSLFDIWLGENPLDVSLKNELLGAS